MPSTSGTSSTGSAPKLLPATANTDPVSNMTSNDFLKLMIAEMQNQDPTNPMDNSQILQQLSQMQSINASKQLSDTLQNVVLGQGLLSSSALIGRSVKALTDDGQTVTGSVDKVVIEDSTPKLLVNNQKIQMKNVSEIDL